MWYRIKEKVTTKVSRLAQVVKKWARSASDVVCAVVAASFDWFKWW